MFRVMNAAATNLIVRARVDALYTTVDRIELCSDAPTLLVDARFHRRVVVRSLTRE